MEFICQIVTMELLTFAAGLCILVIGMMLVSLLRRGKYGED